jgi:two-component system, OmpR family, sensor histidine kinase KdpD
VNARWRGLLRTLGVLLLCTGIGELVRAHLHPMNLPLIYLVGVVYLALREDIRWALAAVPVALLVYSWLFVDPRWSVVPTDPQYFLTFGVALVVGAIVSRLASRARATADEATAAAGRAQALGGFAQALARAASEEEIGALLIAEVRRHTGQPAVLHLNAPPAAPRAGEVDLPLRAGTESLGLLRVPALAPSDRQLVEAMAGQAAMALSRLQLAQRHLELAVQTEAERVRNTLLASISHDFRTPLTAIIGAASTVLDQAGQVPPAQQAVLVRHVLTQARRLQSLSSDLLDLARLEGGEVRPQAEWVPADDLVREALEPLREALQGHALALRIDEGATVWCDVRLASQAIGNLVLNAAQHGPAGGTIGVAVSQQDGAWWLRVRDDGPGWGADTPPGLAGVFGSPATRRAASGGTGGSGLGLAICEVVARLHGGSIGVRADAGACLEMRFPQPGPPPALEAVP